MTCIAALTVSTLATSGTQARTWTVQTDGTGDFSSIQEAINVADHGDEVVVGPGTYDENIDFLGKKIVVQSQSGPGVTRIDGGGRQLSVVSFQSGETRDSRLEGFTITGGLGTLRFGAIAVGGGILVANCAPFIVGNRIIGNAAQGLLSVSGWGYGGGIYCAMAMGTPGAVISQNTVESNSAGANGGGIAIDGNGGVELVGNQILNNTTLRGDGGGVWVLSNRGGLQLIDNLLSGNTAADHGGGFYEGSAVAGVYFTSTVTRNVFYGNHANAAGQTGTSGGGLWLRASNCQVIQNTFIANTGAGGGARGGNIAVEASGSPRFERNIIALAASGGGVACTGGSPTFADNIVWQNAGGNGTGICTNWYITGGNLVVDPLLCSPDMADGAVAENSPALTHPSGVIGANPTSGCPGVAIERTTWSWIKALLGR